MVFSIPVLLSELHTDGREGVWLVIPLGRCVTDALLRSVERGRFRLVVSRQYCSGFVCVTETENNHTKFLLCGQMEGDHCCN